jgi:hypothetical protein
MNHKNITMRPTWLQLPFLSCNLPKVRLHESPKCSYFKTSWNGEHYPATCNSSLTSSLSLFNRLFHKFLSLILFKIILSYPVVPRSTIYFSQVKYKTHKAWFFLTIVFVELWKCPPYNRHLNFFNELLNKSPISTQCLPNKHFHCST